MVGIIISALKKLVFDLEVSLWEKHKKYTKPLPEKFTCYKRGELIFSNIVEVDGLLQMNDVKHSTDPDGSIDFGNIEILQQVNDDNEYIIAGDFGEVRIFCKNVKLKLSDK